MTKRVVILCSFLMLVILAGLAITIKNTHDRAVAREAAAQKVHNEQLVNLVREMENYWRDSIKHPFPYICELEEKNWQFLQIGATLARAEEVGKPIKPAEVGIDAWKELMEIHKPGNARSYIKALLNAYKNDTMTACDSSSVAERVYFGRNSYTLMAIDEVLSENKIPPATVGLPEKGVRPLAIDLLRGWIADWKADRVPRADNSVKYVAKRFGISNFDVGCLTDEDTRKYFRQIPN